MAIAPRRHPLVLMIPNVLTVARLVAAAAFPWAANPVRLPLVIVAGVSDALDGLLARRLHAETRVGSLLDAVADKAFAFSTLMTLLLAGIAPWWQLLPLLARDLTVASIAAHAYAWRGVEVFRHMPPRPLGKVTTLFLFAYLLAVLGAPGLVPPLFLVGASVSVAAAVDYLHVYVQRRSVEA